jgi:hypothetical protein
MSAAAPPSGGLPFGPCLRPVAGPLRAPARSLRHVGTHVTLSEILCLQRQGSLSGVTASRLGALGRKPLLREIEGVSLKDEL